MFDKIIRSWNHLLLCILNICKYVLGRLPKVVGIDVVEMALWAKVTGIYTFCIISVLTFLFCFLDYFVFILLILILKLKFILIEKFCT